MEQNDVHEMRESVATLFTVAVLGTSTQIVPKSPKRVSLMILFPATAANMWLSFFNPAVVNGGAKVQGNNAPFQMSMLLHGDAVRQALWGISDGGSVTIQVISVESTCVCTKG